MAELETQKPKDDPISALHRMSTTAGVATQEYVAINGLAVASAVLGLLTALALVGSLFLVLGLAAIVCGILGLRQIRSSSGTQAGSGLALLGIILALAIAGFVVAGAVTESRTKATYRQQIDQVLQDLGQHVSANDYPAAYALFHPDFQKAWTPTQFELVWKQQQDEKYGGGPLQKMAGNDLVEFETMGDGTLAAHTQSLVWFSKSDEPGRVRVQLRQTASNGPWLIYVLDPLFRKEKTRS